MNLKFLLGGNTVVAGPTSFGQGWETTVLGSVQTEAVTVVGQISFPRAHEQQLY